MQIRFLEPAQYELDEAVDYYNAQVPDLGLAFLHEVLASLDRVKQYPDAWQFISKNARRCQLHRFPYGIIYAKLEDVLLIIAIGHLHRSPEYWKNLQARNVK